jgi:hypothetical protein
MENEFVTYEQALALKELGFDEYCVGFFYKPNLIWYEEINQSNLIDGEVVAPLKQQVFRWFRAKYEWYLDLGHSERVDFYYAILKNSEPIEWRNDYSTYEEAENACIDKLIEIAKQNENKNKCLECGEDKGNHELYCSFCRNQN